MEIGIVVILILVVIIAWGVITYNRFIKNKNRVMESWSGIDVQLKRRHNLIPNLIETVKGYTQHEKETLAELTELRGANRTTESIAELGRAESQISQALGRLIAVAEDYPDLKANENFLDLQEKLHGVEEEIQLARRYYNGTVRNWNILVESFPSNLLANLFHFSAADYFEIQLATERDVPEVNFE